MDFLAIVQQCAPSIEPNLALRLIKQESNFNPYAIGLDGKAVLTPQPKTYEEAVSVAERLIKEGKGFSVGVSQVHISNIKQLGLTWKQAFDPCINVSHGENILQNFYGAALRAGYVGNEAVFMSLRGYNSGSIFNPVSNQYAANITGSHLPKNAIPVLKNINEKQTVASNRTSENDDFFHEATPLNKSSGDLFN